MKEYIVEQLKNRIGLDQDTATRAAEVVIEIFQERGQELLGDKLGAVGSLAGGLFGGSK